MIDYYKILSQYYFSDCIMIIISFIAFIVALKHHKGSGDLKLITYYLGAFVLQNLIGIYSELIVNKLSIEAFTENIFFIEEFILFNTYLYRVISSKKMRAIIRYFYWTYLLLLLIEWAIWTFVGPSTFILALKSLYFIGPCLVYFYELFSALKPVLLKDHSSFWVITGILLYSTCTLPVFLLDGYFMKKAPFYSNLFYALNFVLYSMLCLLIIKAYTCKIKIPATHPNLI